MSVKKTLSRRRERARVKISTTVAPESHAYLERLVDRGEASSLAEALDVLVRRHVEDERRAELERRMAEYYEQLTDDEAAEQRLWGQFAEAELTGSDVS